MASPSRLYPTDLSDAEWRILEPLIPAPKPGGRPATWSRRLILDGIFYVFRSGCQWRLLPREFPPWRTVYHYFRLWRLDGTWERLNATLRERERVRHGRQAQPSGCILDSQSIKTTSVGGIRGYDGAKRLSGRKRHLLVDTLGLLLRAKVHAADVQDRAAVPLVLAGVRELFSRLAHIWLDQGYTGKGKTWIEEELGWTTEIVQHAPTERGEWRYTQDATGKLQGTYVRFAPERSRGLPGRAPTAVVCGANVLLVAAEPAAVQGLRAAAGNQRGDDLCDHEPHHAQETGSLMTLSYGCFALGAGTVTEPRL